MIKYSIIDYNILTAIKEDFGKRGDITSEAICQSDYLAKAKIIAKAEGIIAGLPIAQRVFQLVDAKTRFETQVSEASKVRVGDLVATIVGNIGSLLSAERIALNFLGRLSGIAALTAQFVERVQGTKVKILDTRKTTPGLRSLERYAVKIGGGKNHRFGLYDMFLIKENHLAAAGSMDSAVNRCRKWMDVKGFSAAIEVEAQTIAQVRKAKSLCVDRIMLDNMDITTIQEAVSIVAGEIKLEASGNITLDNVREIAETGVDFISIGSLTHSVKALDLSMLIE
jgi:nicotinate-nucleotide pyrophosphorylase (carboxylating)